MPNNTGSDLFCRYQSSLDSSLSNSLGSPGCIASRLRVQPPPPPPPAEAEQYPEPATGNTEDGCRDKDMLPLTSVRRHKNRRAKVTRTETNHTTNKPFFFHSEARQSGQRKKQKNSEGAKISSSPIETPNKLNSQELFSVKNIQESDPIPSTASYHHLEQLPFLCRSKQTCVCSPPRRTENAEASYNY